MNTEDVVAAFVERSAPWQREVAALRRILLDSGLEETVKWGGPCYVQNGTNVVGLVAFKSYFGLWFHQGALLEDPEGVLVNAQRGKTRAQRQWRMRNAADLREPVVRRYVKAAVRLAREGREVKPQRGKPLRLPPELAAALADDPGLRSSFEALRPGQRREYAEHVAQAKRPETRQRRIEKILPMIEAGAGLNDRYRR